MLGNAISLIKLLLLPPIGLLVLVAVGLVGSNRKTGLPIAAVSLVLLFILSLPIVENKLARETELPVMV